VPRKAAVIEAEATLDVPEDFAEGAHEESNGHKNGELKLKDIAPKAFRSMLVPLESIRGWEDGDPPAQDFIADVRRAGLEQPVRVRPIGDSGEYFVVEGRRRLKTVKLLLDEGMTEFAKVPVVIDPRKKAREDGLASLAMNYQRNENIIGDSNTVKAYMDNGWTEKDIASQSGLTVEQVRVLRNVAYRLDSELREAVEQGRMSPWTSRMAAMQPEPVQQRLIETLRDKGRITVDDLKEARAAKRAKAQESLPASLYEGEELPYDEDEDEGEAAGLPSAKLERKAKTGRLTADDRRENVTQLVWDAKQELTLISKRSMTDDDKAVLALLNEALGILDPQFDVPALGDIDADNADEEENHDPEQDVMTYDEPDEEGEDGGIGTPLFPFVIANDVTETEEDEQESDEERYEEGYEEEPPF